MQIWLSLALSGAPRAWAKPSIPGGRLSWYFHCSFFKLQLCFFWVTSRWLFHGCFFSPHAYPFGKRQIASYLPPCLRGWDIPAPCPPFPPKQTHVSPWSAVLCAVTTRVRDVRYLQGAPSQIFTKVQKWDRVNGFISDSEALTNQAVPGSSGRRAVGFFERQSQCLSSKQHFDKIQ